MEFIIYRKIDGKVKENKREINSKKFPYITEEDGCFSNIIDFNHNLTKSKIEEIKRNVHYIINNISNADYGRLIIKKLFSKLKTSKTKGDLEDLIETVISNYEKNVLSCNSFKRAHVLNENKKAAEKYNEYLNEYKDLVISISVKRIITKYYANLLFNMDFERLKELDNLIINDVDVKEVLSFVGEEFDNENDSNGVYKLSQTIFKSLLHIIVNKIKGHLCRDCKNATCLACDKIADVPKKKIELYDFIVDGYQVFNSNGTLEKFSIYNCTNYVHENSKDAEFDIKKLEYKKQVDYAKRFIK